MENFINIKGYLSYKTNYYESFFEFLNVNNILNSKSKFVNIMLNIRSVNSNFDEFTFFFLK